MSHRVALDLETWRTGDELRQGGIEPFQRARPSREGRRSGFSHIALA